MIGYLASPELLLSIVTAETRWIEAATVISEDSSIVLAATTLIMLSAFFIMLLVFLSSLLVAEIVTPDNSFTCGTNEIERVEVLPDATFTVFV